MTSSTFTPPAWATEPDHTIPLGYIPAIGSSTERFWLGISPLKAVVLLDPSWRESDAEDWVNVAAGAFQACCQFDCSRDMAELIAKGWIASAGHYAAKVRDMASRIILPEHLTAQ